MYILAVIKDGIVYDYHTRVYPSVVKAEVFRKRLIDTCKINEDYEVVEVKVLGGIK